MGKIKAIVKRPDEEFGHMTHISSTLENLQSIVEGYIEAIELGGGLVMICNEEGKIRGLKPNMIVGLDVIVGTIIICGENGEDFGDIPIDFKTWKAIKTRYDQIRW